MIVRELVTRLGFNVQDANLKKYEQGVNNIKSSAEGAANSFRNMFAAFIGFSAIQSIGKTADEMMSLEARVGMLPQTITAAGEAFDVVANRASAARQSIHAYGTLYVRLQNAGKDFIKTQEEGLQVTDTLSKALVVGGASAQEQASAMLQFSQAIGSGVLQGEELRAMGEAAPMFLDELAKAMGFPREQLKKLGSEGKLTSKAVVEAVKKMSSVFDEKFKQMPMTITQAITIGGNRWAMFINRLNRKSGSVTSIANFLLKGFDKVEKGLDKIVDMLGGAENAIKLIGIAIGATLAPLVVGGLLMALMSPILLVIAGLTMIGLVIEDLYTWMDGGESYFGDFLGNFDTAAERFKNVITIIKLITMLAGAMFAVWLGGWVASGAAMTAFVATAIGGTIKLSAVWIATHAKMAAAALVAYWPIVLLIGLIALAVAAFLWLWDNFQDVLDALYNLSVGNFDAMWAAFGRMVDKMKGYWQSFKEFFGAEPLNAEITSSEQNKPNNKISDIGAFLSAEQRAAATNSKSVSAATAANAAVSAGGAGGVNTRQVTINQEFGPGTTPEAAAVAKEAATQGVHAADNGATARQMAAYQ